MESGVVGYQNFTPDFEGGYYNVQISAQFSPINATGKWTIGTKIFDTDAQAGDQIDIYDSTKSDIVSYQFLGYEDEVCLGWIKMWIDVTGAPAEDFLESFEIEKGDTLYFTPADGESGMSVAGQVANLAEGVTLSFRDSAMYKFSNPYPVDTTFGSLEEFLVPGDQFDMYDETKSDIVSFQFIGDEELPWIKMWIDVTGAPAEDYPASTDILFAAGKGGFFTPGDAEGRSITFSLTNK